MVLRVREIVLEIENVLDVGAAPAIDRLVFVAHHADVVVRLREQAHQLVLAAVGVLILVDHDVAQAPVPGLARGVVVLQQAHGFEQQIVEIQRVGRAQRLLVFLEDRGQRFGLRDRPTSLVQILRRLLQVLGVADAARAPRGTA